MRGRNKADRGIGAVEEGLVGERDGGVELGTNAAEAGEGRGRGLRATGDLSSERGRHGSRGKVLGVWRVVSGKKAIETRL